MPRRPEQPPRTEVPLFPFLLASRFDSKETSQAPYDTLQTIVREQQTLADFSVFRLIQNWPESISKAPPSPKRWYVVVLGETPPEPFFTQVRDALQLGEPVAIPDEVTTLLVARRMEIAPQRPYTEIHRTFTARRKQEKQQKKPRKRPHGRRS
ncbi:MAG: hypothetical protein ACJ788_00640 [Ktedonobacteraceae bacterium]